MPETTRSPKVAPLHYADAARGVRHVFVRDFRTDASIGVFAHERNAPQPISISVDLSVEETADPEDRLENVVCYNKVVEGIRTILAAEHINLVETLAERIAQLCLADHRVQAARVRIEKLQVVADAAGVGVEIERHKSVVKT